MSLLERYWSPFDLSEGLDLLIVLNGVTVAEVNSGIWLSSEENEFLRDFLEGFRDPDTGEDTISWAVTALLQEFVSTPRAADIKEWAPQLYDTIYSLRPRCILTLGADALKALWPSDLGKPQGITRAQAMELHYSGIPMVASMNPKVHCTYLKTDGHYGENLTPHYQRAFTKVDAILSGTWTAHKLSYTCIDDMNAAMWLVQRKNELRIQQLGFDTEDTVWWPARGEKLKPHQWDWNVPAKINTWDRDTQLSWCSVCWTNPQGVRETYSLHPRVMTAEFLFALFYGCTVVAWNILYEIATCYRFCGFDMCDPRNNIKLYDGMVRLAVRDQSIGAIGLKVVCQQDIGAPAWEVDLYNELAEARKNNVERYGVAIADINDVSENTARLYNAGDSYYMVVYVEDHLMQNKDGGLHPQCRAFEWLTNALPFFARMECTGTLINLDLLYDELEAKEELVAQLQAKIDNHWAVVQAKQWLHVEEFNFRSPVHFQALIAATYGRLLPQRQMTSEEATTLKAPERKALMQQIILDSLEVPPWALRTETRRISISADAAELYARGTITDAVGMQMTLVADNLESRMEVWKMLLELKENSDDILKYNTLLNYTSERDGRFHSSYRIVRSAAHEGSVNKDFVGAVSGRTSSTPNDQNRKPELKPCDIAPPGFTKVVFDVKGAEMVVIGETTGDEVFSEWARQGRDAHLEKAAILWGLENKCNPELFFQERSREECLRTEERSPMQEKYRKKGKTLNFAALYMQEPGTFAQIVGISEEEAIEMAERDRLMTPGIYRAQCELYDKLQRGEPCVTKIFGRVRYAEGWTVTEQSCHEFLSFDANHKRQRNKKNMDLFRSLWNTWGAQADANDYVIVMGAVLDYYLRHGTIDPTQVHLTKFIHDSLTFDIRDDVVSYWSRFIGETMENRSLLPVHFGLPIRVSATLGKNMGSYDEVTNPGGQRAFDWRT